MSDYDITHFSHLAAAYIRGQRWIGLDLPEDLIGPDFELLSTDDNARLLDLGRAAGLTLRVFKRFSTLPRVKRVISLLRGLAPTELLDIGSGRGVFLWPLVDAFPKLPVTAVDTHDRQVERVCALSRGGLAHLSGLRMEATALEFRDDAFDVVTLLEVLEHIPAWELAASEAVRVARRFLILSVPAKVDENPDHLQVLPPSHIEAVLIEAGAMRVSFEYVPNHVIGIARCGP